jgi:DNA-binding transcriptional regulator YdaS (Cro superfamily)
MELSKYYALRRGNQARLARALGMKPPSLKEYGDIAPVDRCMDIEIATNGLVSRKDTRPADWQHHWPELALKVA